MILTGKAETEWQKTGLCYYAYHKSNTGWPGIEVWPLQWQSDDYPSNNSFIINLKWPAVWHRPRVGWGSKSSPWNMPIRDKTTKIIRKLGFGDKESTMYVYSLVQICKYAIDVVFVNLLLKTPPPIRNYILDALLPKVWSGAGNLTPLHTTTKAAYSVRSHISKAGGKKKKKKKHFK